MLEALNPYSLMVFYVAKVVKIFDNRYFKIEIESESDTKRRITFVASKDNPYLLFNPGIDNNIFLMICFQCFMYILL